MRREEFRQFIHEELNFLYPKEEIETLFYRLLEFYTNSNRTSFLMDSTKIIDEKALLEMKKAVGELKKNTPLQYILGEREFYGSIFKVNPSVLIPRQETEELVDWIIKENKEKSLKILDIGTGSGCIGITLAKNLPQAEVTAIDISEAALKIAKENANLNKVRIHFIKMDILQAKNLDKNFDIIVSNPPYVRASEKKEMKPNVLEHEPHLALFVCDNEPLLFYNKILDFSRENLNKKGRIYFEINQYLGEDMIHLLKQKGLNEIVLKEDLNGNARMIRGEIFSNTAHQIE